MKDTPGLLGLQVGKRSVLTEVDESYPTQESLEDCGYAHSRSEKGFERLTLDLRIKDQEVWIQTSSSHMLLMIPV